MKSQQTKKDLCHVQYTTKLFRWCHTLHAIADNILRAIVFPKLGSTYIIKCILLELFDHLADPAHFHFAPVHVEADNDFILFSHTCHLC